MTLLDGDHLLANGLPRLGRFRDSLRQADGRGDLMPDAFGRPRSWLSRQTGYKQFQYFGGMSGRLLFGCALADLGYLSSVFLYAFDTRDGRLLEESIRLPGWHRMRLSDNPVSGVSEAAGKGWQVRMDYDAAPRCKRLRLSLGDRLRIDAAMPEDRFEPMSLCTRNGYQGWTYANKTAGLPLTGELVWDGERHDLAILGAMGHHDFSCGYMRRETYWNWACLSGNATRADGRPVAVGLNVSCGVNETSDSENCLWVDGRLVPVAGTRFRFDAGNILAPWRVESNDGRVDLHFEPLGLHREALDVKLVSTHFRQVFGRFDGILHDEHGPLRVSGLTGFVEDQFIRW